MNDFTASDGCLFVGCVHRPHARGYCHGHYAQLRSGKPIETLRSKRQGTADFATAFWARVRTSPRCWTWTGANDGRYGYGVVWHQGGLKKTHRVSFELFNGPIPAGMLIDHECHNRRCVRPGHLRLATSKQNAENAALGTLNKSGFKGVRRYKDGVRWLAEVVHNGRKIYLGIFDTAADAGEVARAKRVELFTHNDMDRLGVPHEAFRKQ